MDKDQRRGSKARIWAAVGLLTLVATLNFIDRYLPAVLALPIKQDLHLSDTAIGLINGFGFLVVYAVCGIPIARLSDRGGYHRVISACLAVWGTMTILGGLAQNGWQLALTRMGVALGEAGSTPAAHAFVARNFPPDRRAGPIAMLTMSVPVANLLGLLGGGLIGAALGWRTTFVLMGALSLVVVPVVFFVLRSSGTVESTVRTGPERSSVLALLRRPSYVLIVLGCAAITIGGYSMTTFVPMFLSRAHDIGLAQVGVRYGLASGGVAILGLLVSGRLADRLAPRDARWLLWVVAAFMIVLAPIAALGFLVRDANLAIALLAVANIGLSLFMGPAVAAMQRITPPSQWATASAVMLFVAAMLGGVGPLITGMVSDAFEGRMGPMALGMGMMVVPAAFFVAAAMFALASIPFRRDILDEANDALPAPEDALPA